MPSDKDNPNPGLAPDDANVPPDAGSAAPPEHNTADNSGSGSDTTQDTAASQYDIGYGKPPRSYNYKPGQSGNPKGRRKGSKDIKAFTQEELDRKQWVTVDGKKRLLSNRQILVVQQINKARKGDSKAFRVLMEQDERLVVETETQVQRRDLSPEEHGILADHLAYLKKKN